MIQKSHFWVSTWEEGKHVHVEAAMRIFIEALFIIVKIYKHCKCLSISEVIKLQTTLTNKKEINWTWMNVRSVMQSKRGYQKVINYMIQKVINCMILFL